MGQPQFDCNWKLETEKLRRHYERTTYTNQGQGHTLLILFIIILHLMLQHYGLTGNLPAPEY